MQEWFNMQVNKYNKHLDGLKDKNHLIILIEKEKAFMIKSHVACRTRGNNLNIIKAVYEKATAITILSGGKF